MIGASRNREIVAALRGNVAALEAQIATLEGRLMTLVDQRATETQRQEEDTIRISQIIARMADLERIITAQADVLALQADTLAEQAVAMELRNREIVALRHDQEAHDEMIKQARGDIARVAHQAEIDLHEMRQTSNAIAAAVLLRPSHADTAATHPPADL